MEFLEIVAACFSILAAVISIYSAVRVGKNEAEIKKIQQMIRNNSIENSTVNQAVGNVTIKK